MARKPDDEIDYDFDNFDFDNFDDNDEGGFPDQPKGKARSPIMKLMGSMASGVHSNITDPTNQARYIKEALPTGYQQAFDMAGATVSTVKSLYDNAAKEAKPVIKETKKALRLLMPAVKTVTPKRLGNAIEEWSKEESRVGSDMPDPEESEIAMTLGSIFNTQMDEQRKMAQESDTKQELRDMVLTKQVTGSNNTLASIEKGILKLVSYQDQVNAKVQQKSLELQYRQYFATRKSLDIHQQMLELSKASYDSIIKNTALPEIVKVQNSEMAEKMLKEKFFGAVTEPMSHWFKGIGRRIVNKSKGRVKEFFGDVGSTISDIVMMGEMVNEQVQNGEGMGGGSAGDMARDMVGGAAGGGLVNWLAGKIAKPIRKKMEENGKHASNSMALMRFFQDMPGFVNEWAQSSTDQGGMIGGFLDFMKDAVGTNVRSDRVQNSMVDSLDQHQMWTLQNSKTLNEIIPGWLGRIERNTRMTATKGKDKEMLKFNFETADFETVGSIKKKIGKKIFKEADIKSINENAMKIVNKIDPKDDAGNYKLSADARKALLSYVVAKAHDRKQFNMGELAADALPTDIPIQFHDEIRELVRDKFDFDPDSRTDIHGKFTNPLGPFRRDGGTNQQDLKAISDDFRGLQQWFPDMMEKLLREARMGNIALLREMNLVKQGEDGEYDVNYADFLKSIEDPSAMPHHARGGLLYRAKGGGTGTVGNRVKARMDNRFKKQKGKVTGPGGKTDDKVPAMLSDGEYVVNADSVAQPGVLSQLRAIDRIGDLPSSVQESGTNDYANADIATVEAAVDDLKAVTKTGVDLTNEYLLDIKSMVKLLTEKSFVSVGIPNMPDLNIEGMRAKGKTAYNRVMGWFKKGLKTTGDVSGKITGTAGSLIQGVYGAGKSLFNMGKDFYKEKKAEAKDIYVNGRREPVILLRDIEAGKYFDKATKAVIKSFEDIKGEVVDKDGNIILSQADWVKGLHNRGKSILGYISDKISKTWNTAGNIAGFVPSFAKSSFNYARDLLDGPMDIYVGDETTPRIKIAVFQAGGYISKKTGKPIQYLSDIDGIILDTEQNVVISMADIEKGLVDVKRQPIKGLSNRIKSILSDTTKLPGMVFKFGKDTVDNAITKGKQLKDYLFRPNAPTDAKDENGNIIQGPNQPNQTPGLITRMMNRIGGKGAGAVDPVTGVKSKEDWLIEITDRLDDVYDLLDWRLNAIVKRIGTNALSPDEEGEDGAIPPSRRRMGIKGKLLGLKDKAFGKLKQLKSFVTGKLPGMDTVKGFMSGAKDKITGAAMLAGGLLGAKLKSGKELVGDIIDSVTGKVALSWKKLKEGNYIDKITGKVIEKWEDISGDIVDRWGRLVASAEDFKARFVDEHGKPLKAKFLEKLSKLKDGAKDAFAKFSGYATLTKALGLSKLRSLREKGTNLIANGVEGIKLYWKDLKAGEYFDQLTGKAIKSWKDIKGAVVNKAGEIVLKLEEYMAGLKDEEGKSIGSRIMGKLGKGLRSVKNFGKGVLGGIKSGIGKGIDWLGDKATGALDWMKNKTGIGKTKDGEEGGGWSFGQGKVVDRLDKIFALLDARMKKPKSAKLGDADGDGDMDNSITDIRARDAAADAEGEKKGMWGKFMDKLKDKGKAAAETGGGIFDKIKTMLPAVMGAATTLVGTLGKVVGPLGSLLGKLPKGLGLLGTAARAALPFAGALLSGAGSMLAAGATAVAGAVTLPGLLIGAAVVGTVYVGYKIFQNYNKEEKPITTYRMAQYGYSVDDKDEVSAIANLEEACKSITKVDKNGASFTKGKDAGEFLKIFNVDPANKDDLERWITWFKNRFTPIYLQHVYQTYLVKKKTDLSLPDTTFSSKEQKAYLNKVSMADKKPSPYDTMDSPFPSDKKVNYDSGDVKDAFDDAVDCVEDNADKTDSKKATQGDVKKAMLAKDKGVFSNLGKSIKDKYESAINFTSNMIEKGVKGYDSAVNKVSTVIESGAKTYDNAVNWTSNAIEKGANAATYAKDVIKRAVKWSTNAPAELFDTIRAAAKRYGVDEGYLLTMAYIESKGDPLAKSSTGCKGIYQFNQGTGKQYGLFSGGADNRFDMAANVDAGARFAMDNYNSLRKQLGRPPEPWMLYLAHQQGIGGLTEIIKAANEGRDVSSKIRGNMDKNGGKGLSPQQFLDKWRADYTTKQAKITGTSAGVVPTAPKPAPAPTTATTMADPSKDTGKAKPAVKTAALATTAAAPATAPVTKTPDKKSALDAYETVKNKESQQMAIQQANIKRQDDMDTATKSNALATDILQKQLDIQTKMKDGILDVRAILLRMEKAGGKIGEASSKPSDSKTRENEVLKASEARPLEKPPVSMSR